MPSPVRKKSGEKSSSLERVFAAEEGPLLRYAFSLLGRREVAEEVVQDAFLKLHEHWDEVEIPRAWLFRCVRNLALNFLRKSKKESLGEKVGEEVSAHPQPDDELGKMEAVGLVQMLISEMNEEDQIMLRMKYFQHLKYHEIAERLEVSVGNVGYRLHHLLKDLAERLRKLGIHHF